MQSCPLACVSLPYTSLLAYCSPPLPAAIEPTVPARCYCPPAPLAKGPSIIGFSDGFRSSNSKRGAFSRATQTLKTTEGRNQLASGRVVSMITKWGEVQPPTRIEGLYFNVDIFGRRPGSARILEKRSFFGRAFSSLQHKGPFGVLNMPPFSKSTCSGGPVVGAPYKKDMVGGCEVYHKNLIYGDTTIHFVECGKLDSELVILVHGFPNFWFLWKNQLKALTEAGYHVIAPDLRGYNSSSRPSGVENYGVDQVSQDLLQLVDCCSQNRAVTMVGHDWGGAAVWAFAESHPNKLKGIIIVNSPHFDSFRNLYQKSLRQRLRSWYFVFFQLPVIPEAFLRFNRFWALRRGLKTSSLKGQSEKDIDRYVEAYSSPGALTGMINYYRAAHAGYWSKTGRTPVRISVKVVWGELDPYLDRQLAIPPKSLVPDATVLLIPQVSHWPMWDDPQLFNQALLKFLS